MKIQIIGQDCTYKLAFVKWVMHITGLGLKESKDLVFMMLETKKPLLLDVSDYANAKKTFDEQLHGTGLILKHYRREIISKLLRENDHEHDIENDVDYDKYLHLFDLLYKHDKIKLKELLNNSVDYLKNKLDDIKI